MKLGTNRTSPRLKIINFIFCLLSLQFIASCIQDNSSRAGKTFIKDYSKVEAETAAEKCSDLVTLTDDICYHRCPTGMHEGTEHEITEAADQYLKQNGDSPAIEAKIKEKFSEVKGVCLNDIKRPNNSIAISSYCGCKLGQPDILNNCTAVCANRNDKDPILFGTVIPGPEVLLNAKLGNLSKWCGAEIGDGNTQPSCVLELQNGPSIENLKIDIATGSNNFSAVIKDVPLNTTYVATIVEITSQARSKSFNLRRYTPNNDTSVNQPLKIMPMSVYTCITRTGSTDSTGIPNFNNAARVHFYFPQDNRPASLRPGQNFLICHDSVLNGNDDNPLLPRLEETPNHFAVWDQSDPRFFDADNTGKLDINEILTRRLLQEYNVIREVNIFGEFKWVTAPANPSSSDGQSAGGSSSSTPPLLGFYMQPWINSASGRGYCPGLAEYNGTDPLFKILKEVVGVPTEGLFIGLKEEEILSTTSGAIVPAPTDILFIRESQLKKIWFYYENNKYFTPNETTMNQKTVMFYWPPDTTNPFVKKSTQKIYTIRAADSLGTAQSGLRTSVRPPDKRYGCIPQASN